MAQTTTAAKPASPPPPTTDGPTSAETRRWWVLAVMSVGTLIVFLDDTVVNTALPRVSVALHASTSGLQWVIDAYVLVLAGLLLLCGSLGDRYGRKRAMTTGLVVFGLASAGAALSRSIGMLVTMRALQGLGAALVLPTTLSIITNVFPRHERGRAIAVWTAIGGVGIGLGPALGGYLVDAASWSAVFWLQIPIVIAALAGMVLVPDSRDDRRLSLDIPGALLGTAGLTAVVYGIIRGGETGWGAPARVGSFAAAAVLLVGFAIVEARAPNPMLPMRFFRQRDFSGAVLVIGIVLFAMFVTFFFLTQFFQLVQGRSAFEAGILIIPTSIAMIISSGLAGRLMHTVGPRILALAMTAAMVVGLVLLMALTVTSTTLQIITALVIFGFGVGLGLPALTDTVMAAVPERDAGVGSAVNDVSRQLGGALGVAVIGSVVSSAYRSNLHRALDHRFPSTALHSAARSIGVATQTARSLRGDLAVTLTHAANHAFVDAITTGFVISAAVMICAVIVAATMLPRRMRTAQASAQDEVHPPSTSTPRDSTRGRTGAALNAEPS